MSQPVFYYDFSSPYSYLASSRIDGLLAGAAWRPIAFGVLIREIGTVPWSLQPGREAEMEAIERRAAQCGLPRLRWPPGWPAESYSLAPLLAALVAEERGRLREFSHAVYGVAFVDGRRLDEPDNVLDAVRTAGLDVGETAAAMDSDHTRARLRANTSEALELGVTGVPTVAVGDALFWGDDRLEEAAAAAG